MSFNKPVFFLLIFFALSGALLAEQQPSGNLTETDNSILKTIHSDQLRSIMQRLNTLAYDREYTQLEINKLRAIQIDRLVGVASELVSNTNKLTDIAGESGLDEEEQLTFIAMANQLYKEALNLQHDVKSNQKENINASNQRLRDTCNTCHKLFRSW